jgi:hypothetical protein
VAVLLAKRCAICGGLAAGAGQAIYGTHVTTKFIAIRTNPTFSSTTENTLSAGLGPVP